MVGLGLAVAVATASAAPVSEVEEKKLDRATLEKIRKLQLEHRDMLKQALEARRQELLVGRGTLGPVLKTAELLTQDAGSPPFRRGVTFYADGTQITVSDTEVDALTGGLVVPLG
jgi:hypothetical protein